MVLRASCQFSQALWWDLGCGVLFYLYSIRLGFLSQNVGGGYFLYPVERSDRQVACRKIRHLFSSSSYSPWMPLFIKSPVR